MCSNVVQFESVTDLTGADDLCLALFRKQMPEAQLDLVVIN